MTSSSDQTPRERFPNPPGTAGPFAQSAAGAGQPAPDEQHAWLAPTEMASDDGRAWALPQPFPMSLVGLWPGRELPSCSDVIDAFARFVGAPVAVLEEVAPEDAAIEWNRVIAVPGLPAPVIVWAERARAMGPDDLPDPALAQARWIVGCETVLSEQTPLDDFIALMRLLAGSIEAMPAVLDATTRQWFLRDEIRTLFLANEPLATEDVLWRVHAIGRSERIEDDDRVWLYTVGLWRCGKPELEILELPGKHLRSGITLLNGIAALALAAPLPRPGVVAAIGENLRVTFRPWQEVAEFVDQRGVGSTADRRIADEPGALNPLMGVRAAVCDPDPRGSFRRIWSWPERAVKLLEEGRGAIYLSDRSTLQLARRARATWSEFEAAFSSVQSILDATLGAPRLALGGERPTFLVKAAFENPSDPERGREHLWFEIRRVVGDSVEGELLNAPHLATYLRQGEAVRIELARVSDWRVILPNGGFGPSGADALRGAVDELRRGGR